MGAPGNKWISIQLLEKEIERLRRREQELLEAGDRYLTRAREAERQLAELRALA